MLVSFLFSSIISSTNIPLYSYFCSLLSGFGCHYLHLHKGECQTDPHLEGCRLYKPLKNGVSFISSHLIFFAKKNDFCLLYQSNILPSLALEFLITQQEYVVFLMFLVPFFNCNIFFVLLSFFRVNVGKRKMQTKSL